MKNSFLFACLCLGWVLPDAQGAVCRASDSVYVFSYFTGNGESGMQLAFSTDGYRFLEFNRGKPLLRPRAGVDKLMRDPCIIRGGDGKFHMVWTVSWNEKGIGYASSDDLLHWSEQTYLPVMAHEPEARNCWAPEITYDPETETYLIYWATTIPGRFPETSHRGDEGYDHRIYYTTTPDFKTFSETRLLYDPGFNVIDATIKATDSGFVMWFKNETRLPPEKNLRMATSSKLTGPYSPAGPPITGKYWAEGPTVARLGTQTIVYFDKYIEGKMGAVISADLTHWEDVSQQVRFPPGARHGTVLKLSDEEFRRIVRGSLDN